MPKTTNSKEVLAANATARRKQLKLSQAGVSDAAKKAGATIDQKTISRIENATNPATLDIIDALAAGLQAEPWQLMTPGYFDIQEQSDDARAFMEVYFALKPHERKKWMGALWIARDGVPDDEVAKKLPLPPGRDMADVIARRNDEPED